MTNRTLAIAVVATLASASVAAADVNYFTDLGRTDATSVLDLGTVRAGQDATVEIYDTRAGELQDLIGTTTVNAGANVDVRVKLDGRPLTDLVAVLKDGDTILATQDIDIVR